MRRAPTTTGIKTFADSLLGEEEVEKVYTDAGIPEEYFDHARSVYSTMAHTRDHSEIGEKNNRILRDVPRELISAIFSANVLLLNKTQSISLANLSARTK